MPWKEATAMSLRSEFVQLARQEGANMSRLCRSFGIARKTGYKWLRRSAFAREPAESLTDRSRRPHYSPRRTPASVEEAVLEVRKHHPAWGGRKIRATLVRSHTVLVPAASTITAILRRHGQLDPAESRKHRPYQRFEMEESNELWQMDFKGYFPLPMGGYCHPLTILDDCSRFLIGLQACPDQRQHTVKERLTAIFRQYGLPKRMLMDNGAPWGDDARDQHTVLTAWLIRLGISVSHGRPYHPQTQGKDERLHRTLQAELLSRRPLASMEECQVEFDSWRELYNTKRPHEALDLQPPVSRYVPSPRPFPECLPPILYESGEIRKVDCKGRISYRNRPVRVGKAFRLQSVAVRQSEADGLFDIYFCHEKVAQADLR